MSLCNGANFISAAVVLLSAACAAVPVFPVAMSQSGDDQLTCAQIHDELKRNTESARDFHQKDDDTKTANVVKNVLPLGFLTDLSNEDQIKERALIDRNEKLDYLAQTKGCIKS